MSHASWRVRGSLLGPSFSSCPQLAWEPGKIVSGHGQDEAGADAFNAPIHGLCHATDGFGPAERFFDFLSALLGQRISLVSGRAHVDH